MLFKNSTTVLEPNTAVFSGVECLLSLTKSIGAEPRRDEYVLHRLNLENIQPKLLKSRHLPEPRSQVMLCGTVPVCSQCLWFQCVLALLSATEFPSLVLCEVSWDGLSLLCADLCW